MVGRRYRLVRLVGNAIAGFMAFAGLVSLCALLLMLAGCAGTVVRYDATRPALEWRVLP